MTLAEHQESPLEISSETSGCTDTPISVIKFGSSVLFDRTRLQAAVYEVYRAYRRGHKVLVVVSAIGCHTDRLLEEAQYLCASPLPKTAVAQLLSTGEQQSAALFTIALTRAGISCQLLDPSSIGLVLKGDRLDADPHSLHRKCVLDSLSQIAVAVVPGFIGRHEHGGMAVLGRGGSDLSAVFLADQLDAQDCRLVKDVDGVYDRDPAVTDLKSQADTPHRYGEITYADALRVAEVLIQPKAIEYLANIGGTATVCGLLHDEGTIVGATTSRISDSKPAQVLKVLLLGLGVVGQGVYEHLKLLPEFFEIVGIAVRDEHQHKARGIPDGLLSHDVADLMLRPYDVLIDVSGDVIMAHSALEQCLHAGHAAITASKRLMVEHGVALARTASEMGTHLLYSAAVGGSVPMLEALERAMAMGRITKLRGVLSGTCNFILDALGHGMSFDDAIKEAQAKGFAESDVSYDLSGQDSKDKLQLLARRAFGAESESRPLVLKGISDIRRVEPPEQGSFDKGMRLKLVATFTATGPARVSPEWLFSDDYLAGTREEENRLIITGADGQEWRVSGKGAGRWPTAEAVLADLFDLHAAINATRQDKCQGKCQGNRVDIDTQVEALPDESRPDEPLAEQEDFGIQSVF